MGGVLFDLGVHALDRALYVMDYPHPLTVTGMTYAEFGPRGRGAGPWGSDVFAPAVTAPRFDVDDFAWATVRFESGAALMFQVAWASHHPETFAVEIFGTEGGASLREREGLTLYTNLNGQDVNIEVPTPNAPPATYAVMAQNFVRHLEGDSTAEIITPEQALVSVQIVDAIGRSAQAGREVSL